MTRPEKYKIQYKLLDLDGFIRKEGSAKIKNSYGEFEARMKFIKAVESRYGKGTYKIEIISCGLDYSDLLDHILGKQF